MKNEKVKVAADVSKNNTKAGEMSGLDTVHTELNGHGEPRHADHVRDLGFDESALNNAL
jgi:hypothetical protein